MTRKQFLRTAAVMLAMIVALAFRVPTAQAQCPCGPITINIDPDVQCWLPLTVWCDNGTVTDLNGGNYYPPGTGTAEHCPCPGANITQISLGTSGPIVPVPSPGPVDVTFAGDCCVRIDIQCSPGGGITIHIMRSPLC
jgi:hypothetical protein